MSADNRDAEHEELLALACRAETAARADDRKTLFATTNRLLTALAMHLDDERSEPRLLDGAAREAKTRGEQQVVEQFVNLAREAKTTSSETRRCERMAGKALRAAAPADRGRGTFPCRTPYTPRPRSWSFTSHRAEPLTSGRTP